MIRRKLINSIVLFFTIIALWHCKSPEEENMIIVRGILEEYPGEKVVLNELDIKDVTPIDSVNTGPDGNFEMVFRNDDPSIYALEVNGNYITLILHAGDTVTVAGRQHASFYDIEGSYDSEIFNAYEIETRKNLQKVDSLGDIFAESKGDPGFFAIRSLLEQSYNEILSEQQMMARNFINRHPSSLASLVVLNRRFGNDLLFDEREDFDYFRKVDSGLMRVYPDNKHTRDHHKRVAFFEKEMREIEEAKARLDKGRNAPDLNLKGSDGKFHRLSELPGDLKILYFWAPEDGRSRLTNKALLEIYRSYGNKGLEIYAVSLSPNEEIWKAAIELDDLSWINVSDLKGPGSPVKKLFLVPDKLPYFYLLDNELTIRWKGHAIDSLKTRVPEILD